MRFRRRGSQAVVRSTGRIRRNPQTASYNGVVSRPLKPRTAPDTKTARRLETLGLIIIVLLILALTITRSWHYIKWSAR